MAAKKELLIEPKIEEVEAAPEPDMGIIEDMQRKRDPTVIPPIVNVDKKRYTEVSDTFFRRALEEQNSPENIAMKSEYRNVRENFSGTKLDFMGKFLFMPYASAFIEMQLRHRVSLERKGRRENILLMERREEDIRAQSTSLAQMAMQNRQYGM